MDLPVMPPVKPMLARAAAKIPEGMQYEAKWDGFRALVFRDGTELELLSRTGKSLTRYFPELLPPLLGQLPERCVVDGEIVVAVGDRLDFEALQSRIHPSDSRVNLLADEVPAAFVAFDLLALDGVSAMENPLEERRAVLAEALSGTGPPVFLAPATRDIELAREWFLRFEGAGLDGVLAKPPEAAYRPGERLMVKVKHTRTADCVVAGYRPHRAGSGVGSLFLGLYDGAGRLQYVGVCSSFSAARGQRLLTEVEPLRMAAGTEGSHPWAEWRSARAHEESRMPGAPSRWSGSKDQSWVPLRPEWVCEVGYDHMQGDRFRHTTRFLRWRTDREPSDCGYGQLEEPVSYDLTEVLTASPPD